MRVCRICGQMIIIGGSSQPQILETFNREETRELIISVGLYALGALLHVLLDFGILLTRWLLYGLGIGCDELFEPPPMTLSSFPRQQKPQLNILSSIWFLRKCWKDSDGIL